MKLRSLFLTFLFLVVQQAVIVGQGLKLDEQKLSAALKQHISTLASDKFEGRETGTKGEMLASDYIVSQFKIIGLEAKGTDSYLQSFTFTDGLKYDSADNKFSIDPVGYSSNGVDKINCHLEKDFYPLPYSSNGKVKAEIVNVGYGICAPLLGYNDYKDKNNLKGKIFVMEMDAPFSKNDSGKLKDVSDFRTKIDTAISRGAVAVIFINSDTANENPKYKHHDIANIAPSTIPVLFATRTVSSKLKTDTKTIVSIETRSIKTERTGNNVIGFINNNALYTVVIGAHYDHLGFGDENSLYSGPPSIHHGADDNASGTAAVIELAKYISSSGLKSNNYLFICFSGEEKGLIGSAYYTKNPTINLSKVNYMINMDMVGRLNSETKMLQVNGTGTSPYWKEIIPGSIKTDSLEIKTVESGLGPWDLTSFYLKNIPALNFFSGVHTDYHTPGDVEEKINYKGEISIMKCIISVIAATDKKGKLEFSKTKDFPIAPLSGGKPRISLGVIPNYTYSNGDGMKIDGVVDGKPAAGAGLKAGDVIMQIGDNKVVDMQSYMTAMKRMNKGDKTTVKLKRDNEVKEFEITF